MSNPYEQNPFEVLALDPAASDEQVVSQAGRLRQRALDEPQLTALRQAVQDLTGRPAERFLHQILTHPGPCYHWPASDRLRAAFRRPALPDDNGSQKDPLPQPAPAAAMENRRQTFASHWQALPEEHLA
jgi:hypothetical protein